MKKTQLSKLFICSIVRNAEKGLRKNIPVIEEIFGSFRSVKVFVYENDSTDGTKKLLKEWAERHPSIVNISLNNNIHVPASPASPDGVNPFFSRKRIEKMVFLRNQYLNYVEESGWDGDYLMIVDLDVVELCAKTILESFQTSLEWDAVSAYGYSLSPKLRERYHDTYAYRKKTVAYSEPQTEHDIFGSQDDFKSYRLSESLLPVSSAFGGLAIYRWEAIKGLRYELEPNDDDRVEVYCEHRSIYRQMYERGYCNFFINPCMRIKYQDLTLSLFWKWIKSKF